MRSIGKKAGAAPLALIMVLALVGCAGQPLTTREKGTLVGGGLGAATGAIIGAAVGSPGAGAAIGGAIGTAGGFLVGNELQNVEVRNRQTRAQLESQQRELERQRREIERLKQQSETE